MAKSHSNDFRKISKSITNAQLNLNFKIKFDLQNQKVEIVCNYSSLQA